MNRKLVKRKQKAKQQILQENQKQKFESLRDVFCDRKLDRNQKAQKRLKLWQSFSKTLGGKKMPESYRSVKLNYLVKTAPRFRRRIRRLGSSEN